ncbi:MAG: ribonuclease E/G [Mesosutterella sp.]|nr:ribonuclease E/G [Mesosutterella sp.]
MKRMLFNAIHSEETRVAIVDGQTLVDIDIETVGHEQHKSNIYKGIITRIEPSLEACFVDYGEERHGFLPFKEVSRSYFSKDVDVHNCTIKEALREGQEIIVQVEKEERGNKGAALTTFISLAGRYLVLMPNNPRGGGVSRRIEGEERQELRHAIEELNLPQGMSVIARTAGIGRSVEELQWDLDYLLKLWSAICEAATPQYELTRTENGRTTTTYVTEPVVDGQHLKRMNPAPFLIVEESNLVIRAVRDYFQPDIGEILVDTDEIYDQVRQFMLYVMPDMVNRVKRYREETPLFSRFQIEHQIETAYSRTVTLPSGGAIVIDHTEALVAVDVNSARATRGSDIEETAFRTNCEAADEIARQMRLRDLGGLVVIDFIDMEDPRNQRAIEQRLKEALRYDRARVQMAKISRFGLMELSRQRLRPALSEGHHITCPRCNGIGVIRDTESSALQVLRIIQEEAAKDGTGAIHAQVPVDVATYLLNEKRADIAKIEQRNRIPVVLIPNTALETPHYHIERLRATDERLEDNVASFERVEDLQPVATDPYALKSEDNRPARPKQIPVIKSIARDTPAPAHVEHARKTEPEQAPKVPAPRAAAPKKGFFSRLIDRLLGSSGEDKPAKQEAKPAQAAPEKKAPESEEDSRQARRGRGRGRGRAASERRADAAAKERTQTGEEGEEKREDRGERGAEHRAPRPLESETRRRRSRRVRQTERAAAPTQEERTEPAVNEASEPAARPAPEEKAKPRAAQPAQTSSEEAPSARPEAQGAAASAEGEARRRRRRRGSRRSEEGAASEPENPEALAAQEMKAIEDKAARLAIAPAAADNAVSDVNPVAQAVASAVDAPVAEAAREAGRSEGRRGRHSRRGRKGERREESAAQKPEAASEETAQAAPQQPAAVSEEERREEPQQREESPRETPRQTAEAAPKAEAAPQRAAEAPVQVETRPEPAKSAAEEGATIAEGAAGIEKELEASGLQVVHTNPDLVGEVSYTQPKAPGRPRRVLPPAEKVEMVQIETKKDL